MLEEQDQATAGSAPAGPGGTSSAPVDDFPYPPTDLIAEDGIPLETSWHRHAMNLLIEVVDYQFRDRKDYFCGGNMFIYFNAVQARNRDYRGPDFFFVKGVAWQPLRQYWAIWDEGGRYPDVIIELTSPSTAQEDLTTKKEIYEQTFRTPEYFICDPADHSIIGWRLSADNGYEPIKPNAQGRLWSTKLQMWLGIWEGPYRSHYVAHWPRLFSKDGTLLPLYDEAAQQQAEAAQQQAEVERHRAEVAEAELAHLKAQLAQQPPPTPGS